MTFDDSLKTAVDTLGDRLRDDISRELQAIAEALSASAKADRDAAVAAQAAELAAVVASERATTERAAAERAAAEHAAAEKASAEKASSDRAGADRTALDGLVEGVRAIDEARSLSEILDTLAGSAAHAASRVGVLLVSGKHLRRWRFVGFPASFDEDCPIELPLGDANIVADAVERKRASSTSASGKPVPLFAKLVGVGKINATAIPIALAGEVVAVLYADDQGRNPEPGTVSLEPATLEVLARHAARSLEATTAFKAARSLTGADAGSQSGAGGSGVPGVTPGGEDAQEDEAARRYARLLISEIKLYHEEAVAAGRRDRDLATRLGGEIARARSLFEQRVPAHRRGASECFHAELIRTLGGGDASLFANSSVS